MVVLQLLCFVLIFPLREKGSGRTHPPQEMPDGALRYTKIWLRKNIAFFRSHGMIGRWFYSALVRMTSDTSGTPSQ